MFINNFTENEITELKRYLFYNKILPTNLMKYLCEIKHLSILDMT